MARHVQQVQHPVFCDWKVNRGNPGAQIIMALFRATQRIMGDLKHPRPISYPIAFVYRGLCEYVFNAEIRPRTSIGPRLRIDHLFGLVFSNEAVIGADVTVRHNVSIGHLERGGPAPVIGDRVEIAVGAIILGGVRIGDGAKVGPGALVLSDVPDGAVAMGTAARTIDLGG